MFHKGQSGNPGGRPKNGESLTDILRRLGDVQDVSYNNGFISRKQAIAEAVWQKAISEKDFQAIKYIYDRIDGTPRASMDMNIDGKLEGITIEITKDLRETET
jgi:hypothetical protein